MTNISDFTQMKQPRDLFMTIPPSCWFTAYKYLAKGSFQISSQDAMPAPSVPVNTLCISLPNQVRVCLHDEKGKKKEPGKKKEEKRQESRKYRTQNPCTGLCLQAEPWARSNTEVLFADDIILYKTMSFALSHCSGEVQFAFGTCIPEHHCLLLQHCWTRCNTEGLKGSSLFALHS